MLLYFLLDLALSLHQACFWWHQLDVPKFEGITKHIFHNTGQQSSFYQRHPGTFHTIVSAGPIVEQCRVPQRLPAAKIMPGSISSCEGIVGRKIVRTLGTRRLIFLRYSSPTSAGDPVPVCSFWNSLGSNGANSVSSPAERLPCI